MSDKDIRSDGDWRETLDAETYRVTRQAGTERAFSHAGFPKSDGVFHCTCCGAELFEQSEKFESGCGWPSFSAPKEGAPVGETQDHSLGIRRTEVHCDKCAAHLGHVFPDGPGPGGLRYCINGVALDFKEKK
jgi:peptide-methionine (R)-S-oxide reductase